MSPGPVSDSYDPEFGTGANAADVREAIKAATEKIAFAANLGDLKNIVQVVHGKAGRLTGITFSEKEWRVIRFALNRALESM